MKRSTHAAFAVLALLLVATPARAQSQPRWRDGRVSFYVTTTRRTSDGAETRSDVELASAFTFRIPDADTSGPEAGIDLRLTRYSVSARPPRVSLYDGYAGMRFGSRGQLRLRAGHLWLPDLGTAGALAGGLVEYRKPPATPDGFRLSAGGFMGAEPLGFEAGYAPSVRKYGGYVALEKGFLRRHVIGFATIGQRGLTERSVLTVTNYVPAGKSFFAYQALEYDLQGPANGAAKGGLSYFLVNARASAGPRVEVQGTYNRGRSLDARRLADDLLNGRPLTAQAVDGLRYETAGGRVSVRVARQVDVYVGYARDRNNRDDAPTARFTMGGYAGNVFKSGFDISGSDALIDRPTGPYHSRYLSVGRAIGRSIYISGDYSTSLSVVRFARSDGVMIETRPWSRHVSGNVSATLNRQFSLTGVVDVTMDDGRHDVRVMTGLTYRLR